MSSPSWPALPLALTLCGWGCSSEPSKGPYDVEPTPPDAARATLRIVEGFEIELFAAEPEVVDPVEMAFDENGGLYVAEMLDYPFDPEEGEPPRGRVRYLQDSDGDGRVDRSVVFADQLLQATSVLPRKGGVFVTSAPDILYLKDVDGDGRADTREVWFTGFETEVSPESRITNLRWGLDNWIYAANNGRQGRITSPKFPERPAVYVSGFDFRFNPATGEFAPAAGPTQFGMSFDDWGRRFVTQNTVHLRHAVLPAVHLLRNPAYAPPSMLHYVPDDDPSNSVIHPLTEPQKWRVERTKIRQERYDETRPGRVERVGGHFSAATGTTVYSGDAFGDDYRGNVFVADANGSLVHREVLFDEGVTFRSEPRPSGREFLASTDVWFRPVNMANAPDGALYVMDFYREYIEEPASIPESIKESLQLDFYRGDDRGRIWRIRPTRPLSRGLNAALGEKSGAELVELLSHANGWHRLTAQRLLVERGDRSVAPLLEQAVRASAEPRGRVHALWTLDGLDALTAGTLRAALGDERAEVRENAVRAGERFLPGAAADLAPLRRDPDPKVRFQVALAASALDDRAAWLAEIAAADGEDPWFREAVLMGAGGAALELLERLLAMGPAFLDAEVDFTRRLVRQVGVDGDRRRIETLFVLLDANRRFRSPALKAAALAGLAEGLAASGKRKLRAVLAEDRFARWMSSDSPETAAAALEASQYFDLPAMRRDALRAVAADEIAPERRARAALFLRGGELDEIAPALRDVLLAPGPSELHLAALESLASFSGPAAAEAVLAGWSGYAPETRNRAVQLLSRRVRWVAALLDAVEAGGVPAAGIEPVAKIKLRQHPDADLRARAELLLGGPSGDRAELVAEFRDVVEMPTDVDRGRSAFEQHCAKCHVPKGDRRRLGPDLSGVNNKTREELLAHILDPSFEIQPAYTNYVVLTSDGRVFDGLLAGETAEAVTLRGEAEDAVVARRDIAEMRASTVSLMPDGFERDLSRQDLADVIAYLRAGL